MLRKLARVILLPQGYDILEASSGTEAMDLAGAYPGQIDLLLTDVEMEPDCNGLQLADALRGQRPSISVLYLSGFTRHEYAIQQEVASGLSHFLAKPYRPKHLRETIELLLAISSLTAPACISG